MDADQLCSDSNALPNISWQRSEVLSGHRTVKDMAVGKVASYVIILIIRNFEITMSGSLVLLDDSAFSPGFSPKYLWTNDPGNLLLQQWYQHYSYWAQYSNPDNSTYGSFSVSFEGISIAFTGNTPPSTRQQNFSVYIDDADGYVASYPSTPTQEYMQWYTSPTLEEGNHTITLIDMDWTDVDYALIGVGNQTTAPGKDILVDDTSDNIIWTGDWQTNTSTLIRINDFEIVNHPLGNSTRDSTTQGDSFSFQFTGTNISVFGIQRNSVVGVIYADFSVDGEKMSTFSVTSARSGNDLANTIFFSSSILPHGVHTLVMNITRVAGDQSLKLDYITYSRQAPGSDHMASPSSSSVSPSKSNLPSGPASSFSSTTSNLTPKATNTKRIVGGVVGGGIALLMIILAGALFCWQRKRKVYCQANLTGLSQPFIYNPDESVFGRAESSVPSPSESEEKSVAWRGISVVGSTFESTAGSSHPLPSSLSLSRLQRSALESQAEIRRRLDEISSLMAQIEQPSTEITHIQELQNRIEVLTEENTQLMGVPPPAYAI
ncbi:hypothetical protein IW261DRAFT_1598303 [Armillaria novae-zelandiae]|uniref:Transmembrane protein n=1 Tax=Armillaria novae-zelandiae TaxID=153914 RepID=A0AA39NJ91_9AGAR|nr:hypothetical protein IW261DRAFT_1598303 [Armillaria novae-zelandiae]